MSTDQLLDLFSLDDSEKGQVSKRSDSSNSGEAGKESIKSILDNLGDLWDEKQYEKEYNLDSFMTSLDTWTARVYYVLVAVQLMVALE